MKGISDAKNFWVSQQRTTARNLTPQAIFFVTCTARGPNHGAMGTQEEEKAPQGSCATFLTLMQTGWPNLPWAALSTHQFSLARHSYGHV